MNNNNEIKTKVCTKCGRELPATTEYFYLNHENGKLKSICKECVKGRYKKNKENFNITAWYNSKNKKFKEKWNYEDILWIYNNYLLINKQELLKHFPDINYKTITNIIYQWDIKKVNKNEDWSKDDIIFLKEYYPYLSQEKLMKRFRGRTWDAIKAKVAKLGIHRNEKILFEIRSKSHKGIYPSEEARRKMSENRKGSKCATWKGGLTPLHPYFRSILYEWKMDSLKEYDYKCALTKENNNDLEIHHVNENFSSIILETLNILHLPIYNDMTQYTDKEIELINKTFLELNYKYGLGIPLKKEIHQLYHMIYGKENNNKNEFEEFKQRYYNGEFDDKLKLLIENNKMKVRKYKPTNGKKYRKLKKSEVIEIKEYILRSMPDRYIANLYKVSETAIYNIRTNRTWKEVV